MNFLSHARPAPAASSTRTHPAASSTRSRTRPANAGTRNPRGLTRPAQDSHTSHLHLLYAKASGSGTKQWLARLVVLSRRGKSWSSRFARSTQRSVTLCWPTSKNRRRRPKPNWPHRPHGTGGSWRSGWMRGTSSRWRGASKRPWRSGKGSTPIWSRRYGSPPLLTDVLRFAYVRKRFAHIRKLFVRAGLAAGSDWRKIVTWTTRFCWKNCSFRCFLWLQSTFCWFCSSLVHFEVKIGYL